MVGWGMVGAGGALLARLTRGRELSRIQLALACGVAGAAFGAWMDVYQWTLAARQDFATYVAISGTSLPYNVAHVLGNVGFCLLIGPAFVRALRRYRRRFEVRWQPRAAHAGASAAVLVLALATGARCAASPPRRRPRPPPRRRPHTTTPATTTPSDDAATTGAAAGKTPAARALTYLLKAQNADGGFGPAPKQRLDRAAQRLGGARPRRRGSQRAGRQAQGRQDRLELSAPRRASATSARSSAPRWRPRPPGSRRAASPAATWPARS